MRLRTDSSAYRLALGDLNENGHLDVVSNSEVAVWFGMGDGTFGPPQRLAGQAASVAVADMNRDGLADIVMGSTAGVLVSQRRQTNTPPVADAGPDFTLTYRETFNDDEEDTFILSGLGSHDADLHALSYQWRDQAGTVLGNGSGLRVPQFRPGTYELTLRVSDGRGGTDEDSVTLTITPLREIVLHTAVGFELAGDWSPTPDATAASGSRLFNPDRSAAKVNAPVPDPDNYFEIWFIADPTQAYKLWIRGKAQYNSWSNDSAWVQFDQSTDASGAPAYRIGTSSGLPFNLEECSGCGVSGWGWEDDGWGAVNQNGVTLRFADGGWQRIRIQTREDGLSIDQIVLSAGKYSVVRPGAARDDTIILPWTR